MVEMQDDQGSSEDRIPEDSGSEAAGADRDRGPGDHASPGQAAADGAEPGSAEHRPDYGASGHGAPQSEPRYGRPGSRYGDDLGDFGQPDPGDGQQDPGYGRPGPGYWMPAGGQRGPGEGYGGQNAGQAYGQPDYGYTTPLGYPGGYGQAGGYYPAPGTRARRRRTLLTYVTVAVVAAALGAGVTSLALSPARTSASGSPTGGGQRVHPGPFGGVPGSGDSGTRISGATERAVVHAVKPGLVDITSNLRYQGSQAAATGMVISSNGLVLTNNHVITGTTQLYAKVLTTNHQYAAKWLGYDATDDVAVIKLIGAHNLKTVPFGNSGTVRLGDRVIAIGNAYGAGRLPAVAGKITGLNRTITASDSGAATKETLHGMLQTNAGIVQGDSGGPLVNTSGQVIGMNTAASTGSFGSASQNVGFAIPINKARHIATEIISGRPAPNLQIGSTGFMGVLVPAGRAGTVTNPLEQRNRQRSQDQAASGFPAQPSAPVCLQNQEGAGVPARVAPAASGALIIGELCNTPAQRAGIIAGDVITSVGGQKITSPKQLTGVMTSFRPGMAVVVTWVDVNGQRHAGKLALVQAPPR
jgi:S1-C subfamily serine protease